MKKTAIALLALLARVRAEPPRRGEDRPPVAGSAQSIGAFSNGSIVGAQALPLQSDGSQVMRTNGAIISVIPICCCLFSVWEPGTHRAGDDADWRYGDACRWSLQRRHASHQTGLDVDIFLQLPKTRWSSAQFLRPQALDLVSPTVNGSRPRWSPEIAA
ncbi:penicillin-insensitive murein endopeptidase [Shigella flexneri]